LSWSCTNNVNSHLIRPQGIIIWNRCTFRSEDIVPGKLIVDPPTRSILILLSDVNLFGALPTAKLDQERTGCRAAETIPLLSIHSQGASPSQCERCRCAPFSANSVHQRADEQRPKHRKNHARLERTAGTDKTSHHRPSRRRLALIRRGRTVRMAVDAGAGLHRPTKAIDRLILNPLHCTGCHQS
jgi:hypothetical protein